MLAMPHCLPRNRCPRGTSLLEICIVVVSFGLLSLLGLPCIPPKWISSEAGDWAAAVGWILLGVGFLGGMTAFAVAAWRFLRRRRQMEREQDEQANPA